MGRMRLIIGYAGLSLFIAICFMQTVHYFRYLKKDREAADKSPVSFYHMITDLENLRGDISCNNKIIIYVLSFSGDRVYLDAEKRVPAFIPRYALSPCSHVYVTDGPYIPGNDVVIFHRLRPEFDRMARLPNAKRSGELVLIR